MRHVVAAAILVAALAFIALYYSGSNTPYGPHNEAWNGYSIAASKCLRPVYYPDYNADSIFIIPMTPISGEGELAGFVERGGRLVVLGGNEYAAALLRGLGINASFINGTITDPAFNALNEDFPLAIVLNNPAAPSNATALALYGAEPITINGSYAAVAETSILSRAGEGGGAGGGGRGPFLVAAAVPRGRGYVVIVSDPAIFMNSIIGMQDNEEFLQSLCGGKAVLWAGELRVDSPSRLVRLAIGYAARAASTPWSYALIAAPLLAAAILLNWNRGGRRRDES